MTSGWHGLDQFLEHMEYWSVVQHALADAVPRSRVSAPLFAPPYLDGDRLILKYDSVQRNNLADTQVFYAITEVDGYFVVGTFGESRGRAVAELGAPYFSSFTLAGKCFVARRQASSTRLHAPTPERLRSINLQWLDRGPAPGWSIESDAVRPAEPWVDTKFFRLDDPSSHFLGYASDADLTYLLSLGWYELSKTFAEGLPGIDHVPIPGAP